MGADDKSVSPIFSARSPSRDHTAHGEKTKNTDSRPQMGPDFHFLLYITPAKKVKKTQTASKVYI